MLRSVTITETVVSRCLGCFIACWNHTMFARRDLARCALLTNHRSPLDGQSPISLWMHLLKPSGLILTEICNRKGSTCPALVSVY